MFIKIMWKIQVEQEFTVPTIPQIDVSWQLW